MCASVSGMYLKNSLRRVFSFYPFILSMLCRASVVVMETEGDRGHRITGFALLCCWACVNACCNLSLKLWGSHSARQTEVARGAGEIAQC